MDQTDFLKQLGTRAGVELEPQIDVVARVIQRIAQRRTSMIDPRLSLASIFACALSALAIVITWTVKPNNDSFASLSESAVTSTGPEALLRVLEP